MAKEDNLNIYQKMLRATAEIAKVAKNLNVDTGKGKGYKAVGEADVLAAVKPIEEKYGIYSYPVERKVIEAGELVSQTNYGERKQLYLRIETVYRFVNTDKPDEYIDITTYGDGVDTQDKAPGKAMTYGDKYALLKAYKIQTGDDPDKDASQELVGKGKNVKDKPPVNTPGEPLTENQIKVLKNVCANHKIPEEVLAGKYLKSSLEELTQEDWADFGRTGEDFCNTWDAEHENAGNA